MQAVILAGGLATRLGEVTKNRPKSLVEIEGRSFLSYQIEFLKENGIKDIVLCIGHLGSQIKDVFGNGLNSGTNIVYSTEDKLLGTAGALKHAAPLLQEQFFTIYGDSYFHLNFAEILAFFNARSKIGLMTVYRNNNLFDRSNTAVKSELVLRYDKTNSHGDMVYIDYGLNLFRKKMLEYIPDNIHFDLESIFTRLIARKELLAYEVKERFYEIGSAKGLKEFSEFIRSQK